MTDLEEREVKAFASKLLRRYFCDNDAESLITAMTEDIVWLGAGENQRAEGKKAVSRFFTEDRDSMIRCRMWDERYVVRRLAKDCYLCEGESMLEAEAYTRLNFREHQRVTFIFVREGGEWKISHIHNSVPLSSISAGELFPISAAKEAYEKMEESLDEKNSQIELMLAQLPGGMAVIYPDERYTLKWVSEGFLKLLCYEDDEEFRKKVGNCFKGFILEEDFGGIHGQIGKLLQGDNFYSLEYRVRRGDGTVIYVMDVGKMVVDADGEPVITCFITDITQRKEQELKLLKANRENRRQADFLEQLYNTLPCGILQLDVDKDHNVLYANRRAWEIYGITRPENKDGVSFYSPVRTMLPEEKSRFEELLNNLGNEGGGISYEREAVRGDGSHCFISVNMEKLINADGREVIQAVFNDITENRRYRKERELEQRLENRILREAIFSAYPLIMSINLTRDTFDCITRGDFIIQHEARGNYDEMIERVRPYIHPARRDDYLKNFSKKGILENFKQGREIYTELRQMGSDGAYHWISAHVVGVENPYGDDVLAIMLFRILDEQRAESARQERLLRDALTAAEAANNAKSDFLSRMSHDIRTPMNAIIGMSSIGQLSADNPDKVMDCFDKINASSKYLLSLINDILDMSRIESGKMNLVNENFDFEEFMQDLTTVMYPQMSAKKIRFQIRRADSVERFYCGDSLHLNQILINLLSNSLKFTGEGGTVLLAVREARRTGGFVYLEFEVSDTGIGMSREFMEKLYQPFEQESTDQARNQTGSGLGLSIVYNLVKLMGGTIRVQSGQGKGTRFTVSIPMALKDRTGESALAAPASADRDAGGELPGCAVNPREDMENSGEDGEETKEDAAEGCLENRRILLVEDNELNMEIAKTLLEFQGASVTGAENGRAAVEIFDASKEGYYSAVLMDVRMPVMDGLEAARRIRALDREDAAGIPIIAMSANAFEEDKVKAYEAGMNGYLVKPVDVGRLYGALRKLLEE